MPSERFLRLPREKQQVIWDAAMEEFTTVPFEKASINKIIQKAGISRGSFYTYFEDKRDVLSFILQDTKAQWISFCVNYLKEHEGDFWGMFQELIRIAIKFCKENNLVQFHQNMMIYPGSPFMDCPSEEEIEKEDRRIYEQVNQSLFREQSFDFFRSVLEQTVISAVVCIAGFYKNPEQEVQVVEDFEKRLRIIRYGACVAPEKKKMED